MRGRRGGGHAAGRRGARGGAPGLFKSRGPYTRASPALPALLSLSQGLAACLAAAAAAPPRLAGDPRPAAVARGAGRASRPRLPVPPGPARSPRARGGGGDRAAAAERGVPPSRRPRGECPASRRRRLSPAVTARGGCVCLQLFVSSLPIPLGGGDQACGQAAGGRRAGGGGQTPHAQTAQASAGCRHGAGGRRPRDRRAPRDPPAAFTTAGSGRAPTAGRTGNSKCRETAGCKSPLADAG